MKAVELFYTRMAENWGQRKLQENWKIGVRVILKIGKIGVRVILKIVDKYIIARRN